MPLILSQRAKDKLTYLISVCAIHDAAGRPERGDAVIVRAVDEFVQQRTDDDYEAAEGSWDEPEGAPF